MLSDIRHGARALRRDKGWTSIVVVSLALGIGANTALFSAVNSLFLRKLPVTNPDALVRLKWAGRNDMVTDSSDYGFSGSDGVPRPGRCVIGHRPCAVRATPSGSLLPHPAGTVAGT